MVGEEGDEDLGLGNAAGGARGPGDLPSKFREAAYETSDGAGDDGDEVAASGGWGRGEEISRHKGEISRGRLFVERYFVQSTWRSMAGGLIQNQD